MALNIDPKVVSLIVAAVEQHADGATLNDIIASFPREEVPSARTLHRWLQALTYAGILRMAAESLPYRYFVTALGKSPEASAKALATAPSLRVTQARPTSPAMVPVSNDAAGVSNPPPGKAAVAGRHRPVTVSNLPVPVSNSAANVPADVSNLLPTVSNVGAPAAVPANVTNAGVSKPGAGVSNPAIPPAALVGAVSNPESNPAGTTATPATNADAAPAGVSNATAGNVSKAGNLLPALTNEPVSNPAAGMSNPAISVSLPTEAVSIPAIPKDVSAGAVSNPDAGVTNPVSNPAGTTATPATIADAVPAVAPNADTGTVSKAARPVPGVTNESMSNPGEPVTNPTSGVAKAAAIAGSGPKRVSKQATGASNPSASKSHKKSARNGAAAEDPTAKLVTSVLGAAIGTGKPAGWKSIVTPLNKRIDQHLPGTPGTLLKATLGAAVAWGLMKAAPYLTTHLGIALAVLAGLLVVSIAYAWWRRNAVPTFATTESQKAGVPAADPDPNFSVPASQRFSVSGNAVPARSAARGGRIYILPVALTLLAAGIWIAWYLHYRHRPSEADVSAWLTKAVAPLPVRVAAVDLTYTSTGSVSCSAGYSARLQTTEPLFKAIDTRAYLQTHFPAEMSAIQTAATLLAGPNGARLRAAVAASSGGSIDLKPGATASGPSSDFSVLGCQLVNVSAPPGTSRLISGSVEAWRDGKTWAFKDAPVSVSGLPGEPMSVLVAKAGGSAVLAVEFPEDEARLKSLVVEHAAYAAKIQAAATALAADLERERQQKAVELERARQQQAADLERERQQKLTAINQLLQRGTWFSGVFVDLPKPDSHRVLLEVTDCSATTHEIILLARNDGGWFNTRPMTGTWAIGADGESCTASVRSNTFDAIQGAGFLIEEPHTTALTLKVRLDGSVSADPRNWNLQRVAPENVAATKAEFGFGRTVEPSTGRTAVAVAPTVGAGLPRAPGTDRPLDRSTVASGAPQAPSLPANAVPALSPADLQFFSVAASPAAYVRVDGTWIRLPQNSAQAIQSVPQKLTGALAAVSRWEDKLAGKSSSTSSASEAGAIKFDGIETVPVAPANEVLIAYVGPLTPVSAEAKARYPELKDYPIIELAPERTAAKGVRYATLYRLPGGLLGFANTRVMTATIEQPASNVTLLRSTAPLRRGQYAVACGDNSYEVKVE